MIVENHGGLSSNGKWLASVIEQVGLPNCGTLPDFGNFNIAPGKAYDRYLGVQELMPFAKGVSAKSYAFDAQGNETTIDYPADDEHRRGCRLPRLRGHRMRRQDRREGRHPPHEGTARARARPDWLKS